MLERHVAVDLDQRAPRHRCIFGEGRDAERMMMQQRLPARDPPGAGQERASRIGRGRRLDSAGRPLAHGSQWPQLGTNTMTTWSPRARPSTSAPVSTTRAAASWPISIGIGRGRAVDHRKVGMAESGGRDLPQNFAGARRRKLDVIDDQRPRPA